MLLPCRNVDICPVASLAGFLIMQGLTSAKGMDRSIDPISSGVFMQDIALFGHPLLRGRMPQRMDADFIKMKVAFGFEGAKNTHMGRNAGQCELEQRGVDPGSIALHAKTTPARDGGSRTQHDHYLKFSSRCVACMAVERDNLDGARPDTGDIPRLDTDVQPNEKEMGVFLEHLMPELTCMLEKAEALAATGRGMTEHDKMESCLESKVQVPRALRYLMKHFVLAAASRPLVDHTIAGQPAAIDYKSDPHFRVMGEAPLFEMLKQLWETPEFKDVLLRVGKAEEKRALRHPPGCGDTVSKVETVLEIFGERLRADALRESQAQNARVRQILAGPVAEILAGPVACSGGGEPSGRMPLPPKKSVDKRKTSKPRLKGNWICIEAAWRAYDFSGCRHDEQQRSSQNLKGAENWRSGTPERKLWCNWGALFMRVEESIAELVSRGEWTEDKAVQDVLKVFSDSFRDWAEKQNLRVYTKHLLTYIRAMRDKTISLPDLPSAPLQSDAAGARGGAPLPGREEEAPAAAATQRVPPKKKRRRGAPGGGAGGDPRLQSEFGRRFAHVVTEEERNGESAYAYLIDKEIARSA